MKRLRLLPLESLSGPENMAADEALLHSTLDGQTASLRFYTWTTPTVSLGYFQSANIRGERYAQLPWVRRATGGAMLVHHHELTYAIALPAGKLWQAGESWLCRMHHVIAAVLAGFGAKADPVVCGREKKLGEVLCFEHQTAGDLITDGTKVVGSAQRKSHGALLQHGGILLATSPHTPELPGLQERNGVLISAHALAAKLAPAIAEAEGCELQPDDWTATEREFRASLVRDKYTHPTWNEKR
ncbi:MAG: lipoate--protein ligase family protein [Fimbriiglobus sp.]